MKRAETRQDSSRASRQAKRVQVHTCDSIRSQKPCQLQYVFGNPMPAQIRGGPAKSIV